MASSFSEEVYNARHSRAVTPLNRNSIGGATASSPADASSEAGSSYFPKAGESGAYAADTGERSCFETTQDSRRAHDAAAAQAYRGAGEFMSVSMRPMSTYQNQKVARAIREN